MTQEQRDALLLDVHANMSGVNAKLENFNREFKEVKKEIQLLDLRIHSLERSRSIGRGVLTVASAVVAWCATHVWELIEIIKEAKL